MIQQCRFLKCNGVPCYIRQGVFLIFTLLSISSIIAKPVVGLSVGIVGTNYHINVTGASIGAFKSGIIECEYIPSIDVDNALVGSPISAVALGASIDRTNNKLRITISTAKLISIDSASLIVIDLPLLKNVEQLSVLKILNASFTDQSGVVQTASILQSIKTGIIRFNYSNKTEVVVPDRFLLLNGRSVSQKTRHNYKQGNLRVRVSQRIICK